MTLFALATAVGTLFLAFWQFGLENKKDENCQSIKENSVTIINELRKKYPDLSFKIKEHRDVAALLDELNMITNRDCSILATTQFDVQNTFSMARQILIK